MLMSSDSYQFKRASAWHHTYCLRKRTLYKHLSKNKTRQKTHNKPQKTTTVKKLECFLKGRSISGFAEKTHCNTQQARWLKWEQNWSFLEGFQNLKIWLYFKFQVMLYDPKPPWKSHISLIWSNSSFEQNSRFQAQLEMHTWMQEEKLLTNHMFILPSGKKMWYFKIKTGKYCQVFWLQIVTGKWSYSSSFQIVFTINPSKLLLEQK